MKSDRQTAIANGEMFYTSEKPCVKCDSIVLRAVSTGKCAHCHPPGGHPGAKRGRPADPNRQAAIFAGEKWYIPSQACKKCDTTSPKRVDTGRCQGCHPLGRPGRKSDPNRGLAVSRRHTWYLPTTACAICDTFAWRRVDNNLCSACHREEGPPLYIWDITAWTRDDFTYTSWEPCKACNLVAPRNIMGDACHGCDSGIDERVRGAPVTRDVAITLGMPCFTNADGYWELLT